MSTRNWKKRKCPVKQQIQICTAIDEIVSNIAHCVYTPDTGKVAVRFDYDELDRSVLLTITDEGVPFDPLQQEDPDITLSAEERGIGGLGIYLVRKTMDDISYVGPGGREEHSPDQEKDINTNQIQK